MTQHADRSPDRELESVLDLARRIVSLPIDSPGNETLRLAEALLDSKRKYDHAAEVAERAAIQASKERERTEAAEAKLAEAEKALAEIEVTGSLPRHTDELSLLERCGDLAREALAKLGGTG